MPGVQETLVNDAVAFIDAERYSQAFTPRKQLVPVFDRDLLSGWDVSVYAGPSSREKLARSGSHLKTYSIGVVVRYSADVSAAEQETKAGQFLQLIDEIATSLETFRPGGKIPDEIETDIPFDAAKVSELGLLFTTITIRFKGF